MTAAAQGPAPLHIQCVIAAGGRGTRLGRLTSLRPKPMMPVCGAPFLAWLLLRLRAHGVRRFLLLTGYRAADIVDYFGDGQQLDCTIDYAHEVKPLGTGGALLAAAPLLDDDFLFVNGDDYPQLDYRRFVELFRRGGSPAQVAVCPDPDGRLQVDQATGLVTEFGAQGPYLDCGTKALTRTVLDLLTGRPPVDLEPALWPTLVERQQLTAFHLGTRPQAIDTPAALAGFQRWLSEQIADQPVPLPARTPR